MNHNIACNILGVRPCATIDEIKKAYINACKEYHPDNVGSDVYNDRYLACQEAYNYLIYENKNQVIIGNDYTKSAGNKANGSPKNSSKVISSRGSYSYNHNDYKKWQNNYRKKVDERKVQTLNDILTKSKELEKSKKNKLERVSYKSEDDILNQIRWLRVAQIIHDTIEADKRKGDN